MNRGPAVRISGKGIDAGLAQRLAYGGGGPASLRVHVGDAKGVSARAVPNDLGHRRRSTRQGMVERLQHHDARPLAHDKSIACSVERARCAGRIVGAG